MNCVRNKYCKISGRTITGVVRLGVIENIGLVWGLDRYIRFKGKIFWLEAMMCAREQIGVNKVLEL